MLRMIIGVFDRANTAVKRIDISLGRTELGRRVLVYTMKYCDVSSSSANNKVRRARIFDPERSSARIKN